MTTSNIDIEELMHILHVLRSKGFKVMDLDMLPDERSSTMNKLVIHPVRVTGNQRENSIRNPEISRDNNDIFNIQSFFGV